MHENEPDTGVSPEDEWIYESVKQRFAWPKKELSVTKLNFSKRFSGVGEGSVKQTDEVKFGTPTGEKKLEEARQKAKNRSREQKLDRPYGGQEKAKPLPDWMSDRKLLPKRPPGKV